jgi:hypothetical protein
LWFSILLLLSLTIWYALFSFSTVWMNLFFNLAISGPFSLYRHGSSGWFGQFPHRKSCSAWLLEGWPQAQLPGGCLARGADESPSTQYFFAPPFLWPFFSVPT